MVSNLSEIAPDLELTPEGWWSSRHISGVSYPDDGNSLCFLVEDSSFWFEHRNQCILQAMRQYPPPGPVFDVGGGNGCVALAMQREGQDVVVIEPGLAGVRNALTRGIRQVVRATLEDAEVRESSLPAVGLFDVVEHIADDRSFMQRIHQLIAPGGRVYITVPAFQWLWSAEDEQAGHARRYSRRDLRRLLESAGFKVEAANYFFGFLPLAVLVRRVIPYRLGLGLNGGEDRVREDHAGGNALARRILQRLTKRELSRIAAGRSIRIGGSCLAVARKPAAAAV